MDRIAPPAPSDRPDEGQKLERLIAETRAARQAMHTLVARMRDDRLRWERDVHGLALRTRLTPAQRDVFRYARPAGRRG
jgi:hypothetical protein